EEADDEGGRALKAEGIGRGIVVDQDVFDSLLMRLQILLGLFDIDAGLGQKLRMLASLNFSLAPINASCASGYLF
ncbi:MAG TPA: hypothetical protein VFN27_06265, partial [Xanthobacteraceae bacterium]|nr:hypothetical protein [Xanthobacteraceae bacterium]